MLKVKNKKVVSEIARTTYRANKKRNFLTIFAIFLTTFLIAIVLALGVSYWNTVSERQIRIQGMDYDIELSEPRDDQVEKIRSMDNIEYAGVAVKCAIIEQYQDKSLDKTRLYWLDETCWERQTIPALEGYEGKYPQSESEIMFSQDTLKAMGIQKPKIGMKLPVTYFTLKEGSDEELLKKDFVLCGWYTDYSGNQRGYVSEDFWKTTGVMQTDFTQGSLKISLKNPLYSEKDITAMQNEINMDRNQYIDADTDTISNFCKIAVGLIVMLLMIFTSGYLFIYNTLYISVSKDIRYYGQLKTVGMTSVQLKRMVYQQAVWNAVAGIPFGLIVAFIIAKIVIPQLLQIINPVFSASDVVSAKIWVFLTAGCFAFFTNLISCKEPAKMVGECSPVEALRYTPGTCRKNNHKRESGGVYSMALQNMFRDKKQAIVIFASFTIAISIFLVVNVIIRENDAKRILNETYTYDMQFKNETTLDDDKKQVITGDHIFQIEQIKGVKNVRKVTSTEVVVPYQEDVYGEYYKGLYQSRYSPGNYEEDMELYQKEPENAYFTSRFISVDEEGVEVLNESIGNTLDKEAFEAGKIAVAVKFLNFMEGDYGISGKTIRFFLPDGKKPTEEYSIQIAAVVDNWCNPAFFAGGITPDMIVSEKYAKKLMGELFTELINVQYEDAFSKGTEKKVKAVFEDERQISYESKLKRYAEMKNSETKVKVLGNSIGFIIAMLAVLNYANMMVAGVQNRSKEFATLESIGMTTKQTKKMLRVEGIGYAVISIIISLIVGLPVSCAVFNAMNLYRISFSIPWASNLILFGVALVLCMIVPVLIYQKTQNASIIERLRNGEDQ
ncbi:MAG: ABC transporter permease [Lachnospiraceae bacterium]|nr:ABC transporter permease [Lachnospiraceae bacterium]